MIHKRVLAVFLSFFVVFTTMPLGLAQNAFAADPIGSITVDGRTTTYTEYKPLKQALEKLSNKVITVEMLCDWDETRAPKVKVGERLKIPTGSITTFNMNGYILNRNMTKNNDTENDGELFRVYDGATLTINGGSGSRYDEDVYLYTSFNNSAKPQLEKIDFTGGLLTGGASFDGAGGIHASKNTTITLNNVTIAGMRATRKGYGAGMFLEGANTKVILNSSEITGCYAQNDGGAIYGEDEPNISIELNKGSTIQKNYAGSDGGGINLDGPNASVIGKNFATIYENESNGRGGGILMFGENATVKNFDIALNKAKHGGGIYINASGSFLNNLGIFGNEASEGGGGVYYNNEDMWDQFGKIVDVSTKEEEYTFLTAHTMKGCVVEDNKAKSGGGVRMQGGDSIAFAKLTLNYYQDLNLKGNIVIRNNRSDNEHRNLYVAAGDHTYARIGTDLSASSEVHISYYDNDVSEIITLTPPNKKDTDSTAHLYSDQAGWYFDYSDGKTRRLRGYKPDNKPDSYNVAWEDANDPYSRSSSNAVAGKVGTVGAGGWDGGSDYDKIRFFSNHESHDYISTVFYSDGLFYGNPDEYNSHLATASWAMAYAAGYINKDEDGKEANGNKYYNKHATARQFMADIGCPDQNIYVNDHNVNMPWTDTIGVAIGSKELKKADGTKTGDVLVPITVRGLQYELEWLSNVTLGYAQDPTVNALGKEALGFSAAATQVMAEIDYYLDKYGLRDKYRAGKVKFWITGYSRAGATANITAKRLLERIEDDCSGHRSQVFAYTCEAPKGGTDDAETLGDKTKYYGIHNMVNTTDLVPYVGPTEMGFKRYGIDHYFPEGANVDGGVRKITKNVKRGGTGGVTTVTTYADNYPHTTKGGAPDHAATESYSLMRKDMVKHLSMIDSSMGFDDYFHPMTLDFLDIGWFSYDIMNLYEYGDYWGNSMEDFVADFIRFVQEGKEPDKLNHWSQAVTNRDVYAKDPLKMDGKEYPTVQSAAQDLMLMVMLMPKDQAENFIDRAKKIKNKFDMINWSGGSMLDLYVTLVGEYHNQSDYNKKSYADLIYKKLKETGALDDVSPEGKALFEKNWITLYDVLLKLLDADFNYKPKNNRWDERTQSGQPEWAQGSNGTMMYLPTMFTYIEQILSNHLPQVNMAWARSEDDWYNNEKYEYKLKLPTKVDAPKAFATVKPLSAIEDETQDGTEAQEGEDPKKLKEGESEKNVVNSDQRIILENDEIVGEAVYYDLIDVTDNNKTLTKNQIYRGGINLTTGGEPKKEYQIVTYDMSYGVKSTKAIYNITLTGINHNVIVKDKDEGGTDRTQTFMFEEEQKATVIAGPSAQHYFKSWTVKLLDEDGNTVRDVTGELLGTGDESKAGSAAVGFTMPKVGDKYPDGYQLEFAAKYGDRIKNLEAAAIDPVAGQPLAKEFTLTFDVKDDDNNYISKEYPVVWTYEEDGKTVIQPNDKNAYNGTVYIATIHVPQEQAKGIMFASSVGASVADDPESEGEIVKSPVNRNSADGSVTVQIRFKKTEDTGGDDKPSTLQTFKVNAIDLNINAQDPGTPVVEYHSHPSETMTITAPDVSGEQFVAWDLKDSGIVLADTEGNDLKNKTITIVTPGTMPANAAIDATYVPVVKTVDVNLYDEDGKIFTPAGGGEGPKRVEMFVKISNDYEVHPDNLELTWAPELGEDGKFAYLTSYTATVNIKPDANGKIKVRSKGSTAESDYHEIELVVIPSDDLAASFNGSTDQVSFIVDDKSVSKVFPPTKYILKSVKNPDNIDNVAYGTSEDEIREMLLGSTTILTENGLEFDSAIEWTSLTKADQEDSREAALWTATGNVKLPDTVENRNNVSTTVEITISVLEAPTALAPEATLDSGTYLYNQTTELVTNEEGGTTYYTTDGSNPTASSTRYTEGDKINLSRDHEDAEDELDENNQPTGRKVVTIKAYTVKDGKWDSIVSVYRYIFDNEVPVPEGDDHVYNGEPQVGLAASNLYTLEADGPGVTIDEFGNATAVDAGTYKVKAKIADGCHWITNEYEASADTSADLNKTYYVKSQNDDGEDVYTAVDKSAYREAGDEESAAPVAADPASKGWFEKKITTEDQIISFTIKPADISKAADVKAEGNFKTVDELKNALKVERKPDWEPEIEEERDYVVEYGSVKDGKVTVTVTGKGNYNNTITAKYIINDDKPDKTNYMITYDLSGGELDGVGGVIKEQHNDGDRIKLPKPALKDHVFEGWDGADGKTYKAGDSYTVSGDHTFTAQWREKSDDDPDDGDDPDDRDKPGKDQYVITYKLNGGELNGQKGVVTEKYKGGETIRLPRPVREGYVFDYWKGSKYKAGQKYKVKEDHTFTAIWKKDPNGGGDNNDPSGGGSGPDGGSRDADNARTGDSNSLSGWIAIFTMSVLAALLAITLRRRQKE